MYSLPQEIEVWYILPAIRREFARALVAKHKLSYEKAGAILGISKAAVSQYLLNKRATKVTISPQCIKEIEKSSNILVKDSKKAVSEIQRILNLMRSKECPGECSCDVCHKYNPGVKQFCECAIKK